MIRALPGPLIRSDVLLWLAVAALLPFGLVMVASASSIGRGTPVTPEATRQIIYGLVGTSLMLLAARIDYRIWIRNAIVVYTGALVVLGAVVIAGVAHHGAQRWLGVGGFTLQPGEFAKVALAVALASYGAERTPRPATVAVSGGIVALLAGMVLLQPDLGTVIVLSGAWLVFLVGWGLHWRSFLALLVSGAALGPVAFAVAVPSYQRERLAVFFDPSRDPLGSGFNLRQVEVALGTAGVTGHGLFSGAQSHLDSVAARSSDFMFGFLGAELGLLGGLLLLSLVLILVVRGLGAAAHAPDASGRLLALGLTAAIFVQAAVNIAVNVRLFPATGIPLPFISQGGSSLIVMLTAVGLIQSVASRGAHR